MTEAEHLASLDIRIRAKVAAILSDLRGHGLDPVIAQSWRSTKEQAALKANGRSTVSWSFHNATIRGKPAALAADIVDRKLFWGASQDFWRKLGSSAKAHNLTWGGNWKRFRDVAHVEIKGLTLPQARRQST